MRAVSIIGIGSTKFGRWKQRALEDLAVEAARQAISEARVELHQLGALYLGNFVGGVLTGQEVLAGLVGSALGMPNESPCTKVEGACASGGIAFRHAYLAVASGLCDYAIAVGAEKMAHASTAKVTEALNCAMDTRRDAPSGLSFPGMYGLAFRLYESQYGNMRRAASAVVIKNKKNGLKNPLAQMGEDVSAETIENSPLIADPIRLYDCSPISDGAAAVVLAASDLVRDRLSRGLALPIEVRAVAQTRGSADIAGHTDLCTFPATRSAASLAYRAAGIQPGELDFVELHDCFSPAEIMDAEDLGIVPRGQGGAWTVEGRTQVGGDMPINPSGGLLAKGHPVGATGLGQIYEAVLQLRGLHPNQVKNAAIGLAHNLGGIGVHCSVTILARPDR